MPIRRLRLAALVVLAVLVLLGWRSPPAVALPGWRAPLGSLRVTRPFIPPPTPYAAGHRGVDLAGAPDDPVFAAADGQVGYADRLAGRGVIVIVHGALRTTYEPVTVTVRRGVRVAAGQQIGVLDAGHSGCPAAACLHWGLLRGEQYLDPLALLAPPSVRLLPLTAGVSEVRTPAAARLTSLPQAGQAGDTTSATGLLSSPVTLSLAALAGGGMIFALRRR